MDDFEDSFDNYDQESDAFTPEKPVKKAPAKKSATATKPTTKKATTTSAPKKTAAAKTDKPKAPAKPRAKKAKVAEVEDVDESFEMDRTLDLDVLETPQGSSQDTSPPRPSVLQENNAGGSKKNASETYQKLTQLEHVLVRPDTYIGSTEAQTQQMWVYESEKDAMVFRDVKIVPGLYKIFDEILVNAADNKIRDPSMDTIKVNVDRENGQISIYNNGRGIPIEIHQKEKIYIPELIFGHLLTSSNYDDNEKKVVGGRNGYGAKLCNIFSSEFTVETADKATQLKYIQTWNNNMSKVGKPKITSNKAGKEFTHITFKPDLKRFGMDTLDADFEAVIKRRVYDIAGCSKIAKVELNGERLKIKNFKQYVDMYVQSNVKKEVQEGMDAEALDLTPKPTILHQIVNDRWEVAFTQSDGQFNQVSFVNSIATTKGGTHVDHVSQQIITKLVEEVKKRNKAAAVKPHQIKQHLWVFVNCLIENPAFDSQTKENMTLRPSSFGSKCNLPDDFIKKVLRSGVVDSVLSFAKFKAEQAMTKTGGSKRARLSGFMKLDDANKAGTKDGYRCTLILTEGDSAKALTTAGLGSLGRDLYGVFPLRGKLLNVRDATHDMIMKNVEINAIRQIMGLQHGKKYEDTKSLRYGHLMIMTDQDHDGSHIKGLIINYFETFYPSLLAIPGFLIEFITPIVRVTKKDTAISFFTIPEYEYWKETTPDYKKWHMKYYKGLGTSTAADAKIYFNDLDKHLKHFHAMQAGDKELIELAFSKKKADERKEWLRTYRPGLYLDHTIDKIPIADFINKELILYSMADNIRSIPSVVDGLKPGQRKVMYGSFKRNLKSDMKVAQLGGYIGEHTAYHHGEQSMYSTIIGLAQTFVGSNNINLLSPEGQFGTRAQGGPDAASPRYIFTKLAAIARRVFPAPDDPLLSYLDEDGKKIEPEWFMPVIPMVLVNGADGIGTGWSSKIPNFNPQDIIANVRRLLKGEEIVPMLPWYRGFTGAIETTDKPGRYKVSGIIKALDEHIVEITELPVGMWTQEMKEFLEKEVLGSDKGPGMVKDYEEHHMDNTVHFRVQMTEKGMQQALGDGLENKFKMVSYINTTNMVAFDSGGRIRKYATPEEILTDFFHLRLEYYQKRKDHQSQDLTMQLEKLTNQARFVQMIIKKEMAVSGRKRVEIEKDLKAKGFKQFPKVAKAVAAGETEEIVEDEEADVDTDTNGGYEYLLTMPISSLTAEKVNRLLKQKADKQDELNELLKLSAKDIWNRDLDDLEVAWHDVLEDDRIARSTDTTQKKKTASKFAKANRKRVSDAADGDYQERKAKVPKTKANASPRTTQSKITSFTAKPTEPKGAKAMHTAAFTSVNKAGASSSIVAKKEVFKTPISYEDDDDFDALVAGLRPEQKPVTIDLLSPETAVKPKKTFTIPGVKKPSFAAPAPKARVVFKSKGVKRKVESDDEDEFSFMADEKQSPTVSVGGRRPARAAASKAKTIVLTSDDIFDESEEGDFDDEDDD